MSKATITFVGGGNMANSIIGGLVAQAYDPKKIIACDPLETNLTALSNSYGINTSTDNATSVAKAQVVVLAVKPQIMKIVCEQIRENIEHKPLIISIAAGISIAKFTDWLNADLPMIRCMPNTPALVQAGATGIFANSLTSEEQKLQAEDILKAIGIIEWLDEERLIDAVTALSGSGPAYFFLLMEAMIEAGIDQGLSPTIANNLAIQTCLGAGLLAQSNDVDVAELRKRVSSPGGTTLKALESFQEDGLTASVKKAMAAAANRAATLAEEF